MEKFTATADPYTGIHPFYPNTPRATGPIVLLKRFIISPLLFLAKLPFLLILGALLFGGDALASMVPVSFLGRVIRRFSHVVFGGILLLVLGLRVSKSYYPMRNRDADKKRPGSSLAAKDLIIANHTSYLDVLYFAYRYSPQFTSISSDGTQVAPVTLFEALSESITAKPSKRDSMPLSKLRKLTAAKNGGPVLVFPEGTTTNGRIVIGLQSVVDTIPELGTVNLIGIRYPFAYHTPTYTGGSFLAHFVQLAGQSFNYMEVVHAMPDAIPSGANNDANAYLEECMLVLSTSLKLTQGRCLRDTKERFWTKYYEK